MCAVSAVTDYYREKWPIPVFPAIPVIPSTITITPEQFAEYLELKRRMEAYDAATHQPDCIKPEVAQWEQQVYTHYVQKESENGATT